MWRTGGRASSTSQLLQRAVAASALMPQPHGARFRIVAAAAATSRAFDHAGSPLAKVQESVPWLQQRAGISIAGDGADSHDDFKPVQRGASSVQEHIEKDVTENAVLIYMKGVPEAPQCGFSAMVVRILDEHGVQYKTRNVLTDPELRNAIKQYSKWPTIPQVYVNGEFVGGSDILISMHRGA